MWWDDSEKRRRIGVGWEEAGRLASESQLLRNMFTHEWLLWLVRRDYIDWQFWQIAIKILVQNNASITYIGKIKEAEGEEGFKSDQFCKLTQAVFQTYFSR